MARSGKEFRDRERRVRRIERQVRNSDEVLGFRPRKSERPRNSNRDRRRNGDYNEAA
jgi:hypothetical protein